MMKEKLEPEDRSCARAEDLVTYLYGEASEQEAADFSRHMRQCASCSREMAAFSRVRQDVVEWRNLSLPSFEFSHLPAPTASAEGSAVQKRSALAALRQFFTLAPAWMRAATAVAALAICALIVFTAIHFSEQPVTVVQVAPEERKEAQPNLTERRAEELRQQEAKEVKEVQAAVPEEKRSQEGVVDNSPPASRPESRRPRSAPAVAARRNRASTYTVKASQEARQQLAELVQSSRDEDGLPRLSDLIEDSSDSN